MAQFVQEGGADFFAKERLVGFGLVPEVLEEENNLRRQWRRGGFFVGKFRPDKQAEGVALDAIAALGGIGPALEGDGQRLRPFPERGGQQSMRIVAIVRSVKAFQRFIPLLSIFSPAQFRSNLRSWESWRRF